MNSVMSSLYTTQRLGNFVTAIILGHYEVKKNLILGKQRTKRKGGRICRNESQRHICLVHRPQAYGDYNL